MPSLMTALGVPPRREEYPDASAYLEECALFQMAIGAVNYFEPEAQVGLPYRRPDRTYTPADVGVSADVFDVARRFGLEPLDFNVLLQHLPPLSIIGSIWERAGKPSALLVDPFYGVVLAPHNGGIREEGFALAYLLKYQRHLPEKVFRDYVTRPAIVLDNGVELARHFLTGKISPEVDAQVASMATPEIAVKSVREYHDLLMALCGCFIGSNCRLWFRGQNQDFLEPDPSELLKDPSFLNYRQVRSSNLVPSLYRRAHTLWGTMDGVETYTLSSGAWMDAAKAVLGKTVTSRPGMGFESNPSWESPEHSGGMKWSITSSVDRGDHWEIETRDFHLEHDYHRHSLLLQHYGYPTQYIDVTNNRDVALFFATRAFRFDGLNSRYETLAPVADVSRRPIVYFFALNPDFHHFIEYKNLAAGGGPENLRAKRQYCGVLGGNGLLARNYSARYIVAKVRLDFDPVDATLGFTEHDLFPGAATDKLLAELLKIPALQAADNAFQLYGFGA